jgi:hypothetical protein
MPGVQMELPLQVGQQDAPVEQWSVDAVEGQAQQCTVQSVLYCTVLVWFDG